MPADPLPIPESLSPSFDYGGLKPDVAEEAWRTARRISTRMRLSVVHTGRDLCRIKELLGHGLFLDWVQTELRIQPRSAQNYMSVVNAFGEKCALISYLPPKLLFNLSAKSTPPLARERLLAEIEAGRRPGEGEVKAIIKTAKPPKPPAETIETETPKPFVGTNLVSDKLAKRLVDLISWEAKDFADFIAGSGGVLAESIRRRLDEMAQEDQAARSSNVALSGTLANGLPLPAPAGDEADTETTEQRLITYRH